MKRRKIFLLTPDQREVDNLTPALDEIGYDWEHFRSATELSHRIDLVSPDMVLLNALTPGVDMARLTAEIRKEPGTKILVTSAISSSTYRLKARHRWEIDEFVTLPVPLKKMVRLIAFMLGDINEKPHIRTAGDTAPSRMPANDDKIELRTTSIKLPLAGDISNVPIGRLLSTIIRHQLSGRLTLGSGDTTREMILLNGRLLELRSAYLANLGLGEMLANRQLIPEEHIQALVEEAARNNQRLGELLRSKRLLTTPQLSETLDLQVVEKLAPVFNWPEGEYRFHRDDSPPSILEPRNMLLANVAFRAARRAAAFENFEQRFAKWLDQRVVLNSDSPIRANQLDLDSTEKRFLFNLKKPHTVRDIISGGNMAFGEAQSLLTALLLLRMVRRFG